MSLDGEEFSLFQLGHVPWGGGGVGGDAVIGTVAPWLQGIGSITTGMPKT